MWFHPTVTDVALIILGPSIPLLVSWFVHALLQHAADKREYEAQMAAYRAAQWHSDWAFWSRRADSGRPNATVVARQMQGFLVTTRPEDA
jgi:hypothetical protein